MTQAASSCDGLLVTWYFPPRLYVGEKPRVAGLLWMSFRRLSANGCDGAS